ncbi:hypothetical protein CONPUDRAFT_137762, partial [Coniophora puteana RWD-64-598 SS2]
MSASWSPTYSYARPSAPQLTPVSALNVQKSHPNKARAPIHNPYDKFSKPEFDDWIGGITSALRRALGQDDEEADEEARVSNESHAGDEARRPGAGPDLNMVLADDGTGQDVADATFHEEDSLSYGPSLRAKGKARDPREGPGFGGQQNPIELLSDSEAGEEEEGDEQGSPRSSPVSDAGSEELDEEDEYDEDGVLREGEYYIGEDEEQEEEDEEEGIYEGTDIVHPRQRQPRVEASEEDEEVEEEEVSEEGEESDEREQSPEIIELVDSDEEQANSGDLRGPAGSATSIHPRHAQHYDPRQQPHARDYAYGEDEEEGDEEDEEERDVSPGRVSDRDEDDDQLSISADGDEEDIDRTADADDGTAFHPSHAGRQAVELPDPWAGPREYAEDFYAGGDFPSPFVSDLRDAEIDPSSLTPLHDAAAFIDENAFEDEAEVPAAARDDPAEERDDEAVMDVEGTPRNQRKKPDADEEEEGDDGDDDALPDSSPPPPSSPPTRPADAADADYMLDDGHTFNDHGAHLDWNWPPAFPGRVTTRPGHIATSPGGMVVDGAEDDGDVELIDVDAELDVDEEALVKGQFQRWARGEDGFEGEADADADAEGESDVDADGSVDDEDEGPIPLGTSDLVYDVDDADVEIEVLELPDSDGREQEEGELEEEDDDETIGPSQDSDRPEDDETGVDVEVVQDEEDDFDIRSSSPSDQGSGPEDQEEETANVLYDISEAESEETSAALLTPIIEVSSVSGDMGSVEPSAEYVIEDVSRGATADAEEANPPTAFDDDDDFLPPGLGISGAPTPRVSTPEREPAHESASQAEPESALLVESTPQTLPEPELDSSAQVMNSMPMTLAEAAAAAAAIAANDPNEIDVLLPHSLPENTQLPSPDVTPESDTGVSQPSTTEPSSASTAQPLHVSLPPPPSTPQPTTANPSVPDPLVSPPIQHLQQQPPPHFSLASPPRLISVPGTPRLILSPAQTPGAGTGTPPPVSMNLSTSLIRALSSRGASVELAQPPAGVHAGTGVGASAGASASANPTNGDQPPSGPSSALEPGMGHGPSGLFTPLNGFSSTGESVQSPADGDAVVAETVGAGAGASGDIARDIVDALVHRVLTPEEKKDYEGKNEGKDEGGADIDADADVVDDGQGQGYANGEVDEAVEKAVDEEMRVDGPLELNDSVVDYEIVDSTPDTERPPPRLASLEPGSPMVDVVAVEDALNAPSSPVGADSTVLDGAVVIPDDEADAEGEEEEEEIEEEQTVEETAVPAVEDADTTSIASLEYPPSDLTEPEEDEQEVAQAVAEEDSAKDKDVVREVTPSVDVKAKHSSTETLHRDPAGRPDSADKPSSQNRPAKRRRSPSDTKPSRLTRSASHTTPAAKRAKPDVFDEDRAEASDAGDSKIRNEEHDDEQDAEGSDVESSDGASVASKMLRASRESSVVSNSTSSTRPSLVLPSLPPPTFHAGVLRHQHNKPPSLARGQSLQQVMAKPPAPPPPAPLQTSNPEIQPPPTPSVLR